MTIGNWFKRPILNTCDKTLVSWRTSSPSKCCRPGPHSVWWQQSWCSTHPSPTQPHRSVPSCHQGMSQTTEQEIERMIGCTNCSPEYWIISKLIAVSRFHHDLDIWQECSETQSTSLLDSLHSSTFYGWETRRPSERFSPGYINSSSVTIYPISHHTIQTMLYNYVYYSKMFYHTFKFCMKFIINNVGNVYSSIIITSALFREIIFNKTGIQERV